ncbi:MAG: hypothetical protein M1827_001623 [Pycnora praestabilis]|nr:MAG: hypothetical protein M1827_001623 [Pycnora praestabilis]
MPKSFAKVHKKISKKRGNINSLHENSRDSQRLRRAGARDDKLGRVSTARAKANQPHIQRVAFFQQATREASSPLPPDAVHVLIERYLQRDSEELANLRTERRPGRPTSTREDLLNQKATTEVKEFDTGFWMPDIEDTDNLAFLERWNGEWSSLNTMKFVRITRTGVRLDSSFPPKGQS